MDEMKLRPAPDPSGVISDLVENTTINRRQFMRLGFNTAGGVLAASLGALGFAAILLPPSGAGGGDAAVKFWAKGREDDAWYGAMHLQAMSKSVFEAWQNGTAFELVSRKARFLNFFPTWFVFIVSIVAVAFMAFLAVKQTLKFVRYLRD